MLNRWINQATKVAVVELASPKNRNALSRSLLQELQNALHELMESSHIRAIVLQHQGPVFSSGHDLKEMRQLVDTQDQQGLQDLFQLCSDTMQVIATGPTPVIAKVRGTATAAGCQLVASCDLAYASIDGATFATPGVNIGLFCSTPAVALGRAIGRKRAMEMLLTGQPISAKTAEDWGLINRAVSSDQLDDVVETMANLIASKAPHSIAVGKPTFVQQLPLDLKDAYQVAGHTMCANALTDECQEGIAAFLHKRPPQW